jgi:hypothetical protein
MISFPPHSRRPSSTIPHRPLWAALRLLVLGVVGGMLAHTPGIPPLRSVESEANVFTFNYNYWTYLRGRMENKGVIDIKEREQWVRVEMAWKKLAAAAREVE